MRPSLPFLYPVVSYTPSSVSIRIKRIRVSYFYRDDRLSFVCFVSVCYICLSSNQKSNNTMSKTLKKAIPWALGVFVLETLLIYAYNGPDNFWYRCLLFFPLLLIIGVVLFYSNKEKKSTNSADK